MSVRELDAVFYVASVPEIFFRDGMFHVGFDVGKCHFEFAMAPNVFLKAHRGAGGTIAKFHARAGVSDFKKLGVH